MKGEVRALILVQYLQNLSGVLTRGQSNLCDNAPLITSFSVSGVKHTGLPVIVSSFVNMEAKSKLNMEYLVIDPTLLQYS